MPAYRIAYKRSRKSLHTRLLTSVLTLIYLVATLLPVSAVSAASPYRDCHEYEAASVASVNVPDASQQVKISKKQVDKAVFIANWHKKLPEMQMAERIVFDQFLYHEDKMPGGFDNAALSRFREEYRYAIEYYEKLLPDDDKIEIVVHTILNFALDRPELAPAVPFVWRQLQKYAAESVALDDVDLRIGQSAQRYELGHQLLNRSKEIVATVFECAHKFPEVAKAFDSLHKDTLNASILDDSMTILEKNVDLEVPQEIKGRIAEDGTITISLDELTALSQKEFNKIHETIDEMKESLAEIDANQEFLILYLKHQELKAQQQAIEMQKDEKRRLQLDAAKAGLSIITTIASEIDPQAANYIQVVGGSTIQVAEAMRGWLKATTGLKGIDKVASLSTVMMTSNVLGAVMNVVGLFGEGQPSLDQQILEEIGKLREQVEDLRLEMHDRFDRIDLGLNAIYTTMNERFDQIDLQLGRINGNIQEVQKSLLTLDLSLSRIERNNFEFLNALGRRPLLEAINGGLGYEERTGVPMPYQPDFINFENTLHSWATIHAFDPVNAGPTQRNYSDGQLLAELKAYPLDANINYLNGWMVAHGLPAITDKHLPSPRDWLLASRAYTQLGLEWPEHMKRIDVQRYAELNEIGVELEAAMQKLSTQLTTLGPEGNSLLFSTVITHYEDKLDLLDESIQQMESDFVSEVQQHYLQRDEPFNLYGGPYQTLEYATPEISALTCGDAEEHGSYPLSSDLKSLIPNFELYNMAEYLRLGSFAGCLSDEWEGLEEKCEYDPERPNAPPDCYWEGDHKAVLTIYFDSVPVMRQTIHDGMVMMRPNRADIWTKYNWLYADNYKKMFDALTTADQPTPEMAAQQEELRQRITEEVENRLSDFQQSLYSRVLNEMSQGSLQSTATEIAGARELLNAFTTLGFQRALRNDEFLHAMLFGSQQLVDETQIMHTYALSITQPITGSSLLVNPRVAIGQVADERTEVFSEMLNEYLTGISEETFAEGADYIGNTRRALALTMRIAHVDLPEPQAIDGLQATSDSPTLLGNATKFTASVSAGNEVFYEWDFGDGNTATGPAPSHTYAEAGAYIVNVTASNSIGESSVGLVVQVHAANENEVPIAGLSATQEGPAIVGDAVRFTAKVDEGSNVTFAWDFGDGSVGVGANVSHTFAELGIYSVKVIASNSVSQASATLPVVVSTVSAGGSSTQIHLPLIQR